LAESAAIWRKRSLLYEPAMNNLQELFDQAITLHQRGALDEAERFY
jgi:hypothetical protein